MLAVVQSLLALLHANPWNFAPSRGAAPRDDPRRKATHVRSDSLPRHGRIVGAVGESGWMKKRRRGGYLGLLAHLLFGSVSQGWVPGGSKTTEPEEMGQEP